MDREFTKIPSNTFETLQLNAGILVTNFDPSDKTYDAIIGATTNGVKFNDSPTFVDMGEDVDNAPANTKELKVLSSREIKMTGTFVSVTAGTVKKLVATADIDSNDSTHIIPRDKLKSTDFSDIWWIGDYGNDGGFIAIHLINALSTTGFQIQSGKNAKGQFSFEFMAHYSIPNTDKVPYEIYIDAETTDVPQVNLNKHSVTIAKDDTFTLTADVIPAGSTVTWSSSNNTYATVSGGVVTGEAVGSATITASITVDGVAYTDTCTVIVEAAA